MPDETPIRLGSIATFTMGQSPPSTVVVDGDRGIPFLQGCADFGEQYPKSHYSCLRPLRICKRGDVLISVRAPVGAINKADREYCIGRGLAAVRLPEDYPVNYGWHLLGYWAPALHRVSQGTTFKAVGRDDLADLEILDIVPKNRLGLTSLLDAIDEVIAKTEALIEKLKAMKLGLLHDLLTCGLDENGKPRDPKAHPEQFKDSVLGLIPREWKIVRLRERTSLYGGKRLPFGHGYSTKDSNFVYLRVVDFYQRDIDFSSLMNLSESTFKILSRYEIKDGDIYVSIAGSIGYAGVFRSPSTLRAILTENSVRVEITSGLDPDFLALQLNGTAVQRQISNQKGTGGGVPKLALFRIENLLIAIPKPKEQQAIVEKMASLEMGIRKEYVHANKLIDIKKGFMHDLLTGKVRVKIDTREEKTAL